MLAEYLESDLLRAAGFRHAFFTRNGGVSSGAYASLNFSSSVGDDASNVEQNFARASAVLGVASDRICFLSQVHGATVHVLNQVPESSPRAAAVAREGDALLGSQSTLAYAVRTADCVPILLADPRSGAVAAVHAGWRGVVRGVVEAAVRALERGGADVAELLAAIGPHIGPRAFEVGEDVAAELEAKSPVGGVVDRTGAKPRVNLGSIAAALLRDLGLAGAHIQAVEGCTFTDSEHFFSFRRDGKQSGRLLSAIVPLQRG